MEKKEEEIKHPFSCLVENRDDVRGQIAYALYKYKKIDRIKNVYNGNPMTPKQKETFRKENTTEKSINDYLEQAENILKDYVSMQLKITIEQAERDFEKNKLSLLEEELKKHLEDQKKVVKKWNWMAFLESLVASLLQPIALILLFILIAVCCGVDVSSIIKALINIIIKAIN